MIYRNSTADPAAAINYAAPRDYLRAWWPATYVGVLLHGVRGIACHLSGDTWAFVYFGEPTAHSVTGVQLVRVFRTEIDVDVSDANG
jgi:hypothetical protein